MMRPKSFPIQGPYDLALSLRAASRFSPDRPEPSEVFHAAVRVGSTPVLMEVNQPEKGKPLLDISSPTSQHISGLVDIAYWMLFGELELKPFYAVAGKHEMLSPIVEELHGLKPMRPASLFEMAVTAITEQQISLAAAYRIRGRILTAFGDRIDGLWAFPCPDRLAQTTVEEMKNCGLSRRKAEYIKGLAVTIVNGLLDLDDLKDMDDEDARSYIINIRGFGSWSADYILVRGLGRVDCIPADDLGIQTIVGKYLGDGSRPSPEGVRKALEPFAPYRGLTAFYLLAHSRLHREDSLTEKMK
ncbi:MAG: DNA-3-methyladenine glycosylase family protein [Desulfomonilia bacterium]